MTQAIAPQVLNPQVAYDPVQELSSSTRWMYLWKAGGIGAAVSTVAIAFFAALSAHVLCAAPIALATIITLSLIKSHVWSRGVHYEQKTVVEQRVLKEPCFEMTDEEFAEELEKNQINSPSFLPPIEPSKLRAVYALYQIFKGEAQFLASKIKAHLNLSSPNNKVEIRSQNGKEPQVAVLKDFLTANLDWSDQEKLAISNEIRAMHLARRKLAQKAADSNLEAAYALKLLHSPYETRQLRDFAQISPYDTVASLLNKAAGDPGADIYVKAKNRNYTAEELCQMDTVKLAQAVFEVPKRGFFL